MARRKKNSTDDNAVKIGQDGAGMTEDNKRKLEDYISEIERLEAEKATTQQDISELYNSAKDSGFDVQTMRTLVKLRKQTAAKRKAQEDLLDVYKHALGMLADLPLGAAAIEKATKAA